MNEVFNQNEILNQDIDDLPLMIKAALENSTQKEKLKFSQIKIGKSYLQGLKMIILTGDSSSYCASEAAAYNIELLCDIPTVSVHSQLLMNTRGIPAKDTLVIACSKNGEDTDTVFAAKRAIKNGAKVIAITANPKSTMAKLANHVLLYSYNIPDDIRYLHLGSICEIGILGAIQAEILRRPDSRHSVRATKDIVLESRIK